jgi:hypothetical protein
MTAEIAAFRRRAKHRGPDQAVAAGASEQRSARHRYGSRQSPMMHSELRSAPAAFEIKGADGIVVRETDRAVEASAASCARFCFRNRSARTAQ